MSNNTNTEIKHKLILINLVQELINKSKACKIRRVSRDAFFRYEKKKAYEQGGGEALIDSNRSVPNFKIE